MMIKGYFDIHSHILPGVDDGSKNMEMTLQMADAAYEQGVRNMIATPHYYPGHKNESKKEIEKVYKETVSAISRKYKDFTLLLGNEIYYKAEIIELLKKKEIFTLADTRYILIEFSTTADYRYLYNAVQQCVNNGYYPVLAHIERYQCLYKNEKKVAELINAGAYIQTNAENYRKGLFLPGRNYCMKLVQSGMVHFLGSDCHNMTERKPDFGKAVDYLEQKIDKKALERLVTENPMQLLENKCI